jgi:molybdopterin molybdotransferase
MISVKEADSIIHSNLFKPSIIKVGIDGSVGKVLAEPISADRDFPPFDRATMDGIAINYDTLKTEQKEFTIEGIQAAGEPAKKLNSKENCIEIMTGAMLPHGTDTIVPYEALKIVNGKATLTSPIEKGKYIHLRGSDAKKNQTLLNENSRISAAEVALIASVGKAKVTVYDTPKIAIISTGNELVDISETPLPHQIRKSNSYALQATLSELSCLSQLFHLADDEIEIKIALGEILSEFDVVILSGGISKGKFDFIPAALASLGINKLFHQVNQRPGKPMWFGRSTEKFVFALPGNPVSTFMCFHRYIKPWLQKSMGIDLEKESVMIASDYSFAPALTYFLQVKIKNEEGKLMAYPITGGGSGDFVNLREVDGFLELPPDKNEFKAGEVFDYIQFR